MRRTLLTLCILLTIAGCGNSRQETKDLVYRSTYSSTPSLLRKQFHHCNSTDFKFFSMMFDLHLFINGEKKSSTEDFSQMLQGTNVENDSVSKTNYDETADIFFNGRFFEYELKSSPKMVEICPSDTGYEADTVESAALNASFYINKTHQRVSSIVPDLFIPKIVLNISPAITMSYLKRSDSGEVVKFATYRTDNAYYTPYDGSITFLPHSNEYLKNTSVRFWEVPMVASHEYGHHVFQSIYQENSSESTHHNCFENLSRDLKSSDTRDVNKALVLRALNEGFADLIAYYSLEQSESSFAKVKCLEVNRDVGAANFYYGHPKKFTSQVLDSFFNRYVESYQMTCEFPSFQEAHTLGAIFAYSADSVLTLMTSSKDEKLAAMIEWAKLLKAQKGTGSQSPKKFLTMAFKDFVRLSANKFKHPYDSNLCSKVEELFPELDMSECESL